MEIEPCAILECFERKEPLMSAEEKIEIKLSNEDALILFDWLARFNDGCDATPDDVERQLLCNLEATFEKLLVEPFAENYSEILALAKERSRGQL
jgi:hypothetical protein